MYYIKNIITVCLILFTSFQTNALEFHQNILDDEYLVFEGEVMEVYPSFKEDILFPFEIVKYKINSVYDGKYNKSNILIYQLPESETKISTNVGDIKCITAVISEDLEKLQKKNENKIKNKQIMSKYISQPFLKVSIDCCTKNLSHRADIYY